MHLSTLKLSRASAGSSLHPALAGVMTAAPARLADTTSVRVRYPGTEMPPKPRFLILPLQTSNLRESPGRAGGHLLAAYSVEPRHPWDGIHLGYIP
jgi:hypothetical protein